MWRRAEYAAALAELAARTGWALEVTPEANQAALNALVGECLPAGWEVRKGPSIHRSERRVAVTVAPPHDAARSQRTEIAARYAAISGYALEVAFVEGRGWRARQWCSASLLRPGGGEPLEINAAYAALRQALAGTTLYKTSLKDDAIVLSFISSQVGRASSGSHRPPGAADRLAAAHQPPAQPGRHP